MLSRRESISTFTSVEEDRVRRFASTVSLARRTAFTAPVLLLQGCSELMRHGFVSEGLVVLGDDLRIKSGNRVEFLRLCSSETCQCAKHCALDFGDFGVLHGVHQCVLGASRVALRLGRCVLLTEECDQRDILQHLLSASLLLLTVVAGATSSDCSIEGADDALSGGGLLNCCAADCLWLAGSGVVVVKLLRPPTAS